MKKTLIATVCIALAAGLSSVTAAEMMKGDLSKTMKDAPRPRSRRWKPLKLCGSCREERLDSHPQGRVAGRGFVKKVTDETWTKMHGLFHGKDLKRMKLYPAEDSTKTEEFYFYNNKPVFVFVEENGMGKENHDEKAVGSKYYFVDGKLVAAMSRRREVDGRERRRCRENGQPNSRRKPRPSTAC